MKCVLQRVLQASVTVDGETTGSIERGLLAYVSYAPSDCEETFEWMAKKIFGLRLFGSESGDRFDQSVVEINGCVLLVSNFTLHANCKKGRRPDFIAAASPEIASRMHERFVALCRSEFAHVQEGRFGAHMLVSSVNDGPVTIVLERE